MPLVVCIVLLPAYTIDRVMFPEVPVSGSQWYVCHPRSW